MTKISPLVAAPPLVFAGLAVLFFLGMYRDNPNALPSTFVGAEAPALRLDPVAGEAPFTAEDLASGAPVIVNYWASWCAPCRAEHPQLEALAEAGVPVFGINYKDVPGNAAAFLDELGDPFAKQGADPEGRTALEWGVYGVPETYVIDGDGRVVLRFAGPITPEALADQIQPALEAAAGAVPQG